MEIHHFQLIHFPMPCEFTGVYLNIWGKNSKNGGQKHEKSQSSGVGGLRQVTTKNQS